MAKRKEEASTEIVVIDETTVLQAFTSGDGLEAVIKQASEAVAEFKHDLSTAAGRSRTASLARRVASLKVNLDDMGKDLVSGWKTQAKAVDANRKAMRDGLDALKVEARRPLSEWEEEQERIEEEKKAAQEAEALADQIEADHEIALLLDEKIDRDAADALAEEARIQEQARKDAEEARIKREVEIAAAAKKKAEDAAKAAADKAEADKQAAIRAQIAAEVAAEQAIANAELEKEAAAKRQAEAERRVRDEEIRKAEAKAAAEQAEIAKREANTRHVSKIRGQAKECFMTVGFSEEDARRIVLAVAKGKIANISITY